MPTHDWGKFGLTRSALGTIALVVILIIVGVLISMGDTQEDPSRLQYDDVFLSKEELAAQERAAQERAIMQEVDAEGRPTERAKLKVLESLRAQ